MPPATARDDAEQFVDVVAAELLEGFQAVEFYDDRVRLRDEEDGKFIVSSGVSEENGERFLQWLIYPVKIEDFYENYWERKPFVVRRSSMRDYYSGWFSKIDIESLLEKGKLEYGRGIDVTNYVDNERQTLNKNGIANAQEVWEKYSSGCSVRVLHPQRWSDSMWSMLSFLESHWNSIAGSNVYLTPPNCQGFSPHFDDIEAFILQVEGKKQWKVYKPRNESEVLPMFSSENFKQEEIGEPILEVELAAGDLLFMPRGTIHQAVASPECHSLHITISTGQQNSWANYLGLALPRAVELAAEDFVQLRGSVPRNLFDFMGVVHQDKDSDSNRKAFMDTVTSFFDHLLESGPWDSAVDQMAVHFTHKRLPLCPKRMSKKAARKIEKRKASKVSMASKVRLTAPGVGRLVLEEGSATVHHMLENLREEHNVWLDEGGAGRDAEDTEGASSMESALLSKKRKAGGPAGPGDDIAECTAERGQLKFSEDSIEVLDQLMVAYPNPVVVSEIEADSEEDVLLVVQSLVNSGVLTVVG